MEIFGVGPLEFLLILVLALVILGPEDMVGTARKIGQWVYRVVRSPTWRSILETSQDLRDLPKKIVRDAGLEETMKEIKQTADEVKTDLSETTREINAEMQAATSQVNLEMQTAMQEANAGMKEAGAETQAALESAAAGLSGSENTIAPPPAQVEAAAQGEAVPLPQEEPRRDPYLVQLDTIATGLGGKEIQSEAPAKIAATAVSSGPVEKPKTEAPSQQPYVAGLETFAQALGAPTSGGREAQKTVREEPAPAVAEPAPPPWALGIPVGLDLSSAGGMEVLMKNRMDEMLKSIEKLEAKAGLSTGKEEAPASTQAEESAPPPAQAAPPGDNPKPAAAPTRVRRNAKRPLEAKTAPTPELIEGQAPIEAPRKRAAKTTLPAAEAVEGEAPKAAPRKRAVKTPPPAAEATEGELPKTSPRKRNPKKTPVAETAEQDSASAQA